MTDVSREGRITPGCTRDVQARARRGLAAHRGLRAPPQPAHASASSSRTPAARGRRSCSGRGSRAPAGRQLAAHGRLPASPTTAQPDSREMNRSDMDAVRDAHAARRTDGGRSRLRHAGAALRARLPPGELHLAAHQPADGRVRRRRSRTGCASRSRSSTPSAPCGPPQSRSRCASRRPTGRPAAWSRRTRWRSRAPCRRTAATSSTCRPVRRSRTSAPSTVGCSRRRSPTGSGTRPGCRR